MVARAPAGVGTKRGVPCLRTHTLDPSACTLYSHAEQIGWLVHRLQQSCSVATALPAYSLPGIVGLVASLFFSEQHGGAGMGGAHGGPQSM